jgi:nucleotide-binding universal stress UspA family protein
MIMNPVPKCLLLPLDESEESLRPVDFLGRLYPKRDHLTLILSHFVPALAPIYQQKPSSKEMAQKKKELIQSREEEARAVLDKAHEILIEAGFSKDIIQEHIQEKELSVAHHACRLADIKKVDAVVIQKRITSRLEGFLKGDPTPALLHHCLVSPVWMVEGTVDPSKAAVFIRDENASLRAVDHAAFMLAETEAQMATVHFTKSVSTPIESSASEPTAELEKWKETTEGKKMNPFLEEARWMIEQAGIQAERHKIAILPSKGKIHSEILSYCQQQKIGIVILGHHEGGGTWGFLKSSITEKILGDFKNMAVWVNQ